jgi:hypothetical protein
VLAIEADDEWRVGRCSLSRQAIEPRRDPTTSTKRRPPGLQPAWGATPSPTSTTPNSSTRSQDLTDRPALGAPHAYQVMATLAHRRQSRADRVDSVVTHLHVFWRVACRTPESCSPVLDENAREMRSRRFFHPWIPVDVHA